MDMSPFLPECSVMDTAAHVAAIAEQGYTIVEDAIDAELVDALADDLLRLERDLEISPAKNSFEGERTWRGYNPLLPRGRYQRAPVPPPRLPTADGALAPG